MQDDSTQGLSPQQLVRLLALGAKGPRQPDAARQGRAPADVLDEMLGHRLTLDELSPDSLPVVLGRPCNELLFNLGRTMGEVLLDESVQLPAIVALKDYGKALARCGEPGPKHAAATVLYYAAIAAALVGHGEKITQHRYEKLDGAFAKLAREPWVPGPLRGLLERARAACKERQS